MATDEFDENMANAVFRAAISERRCAELWDCLTEGGSATFDVIARKLVLYPRSVLEQLASDSGLDIDYGNDDDEPSQGPVSTDGA
ncbi:hypothetical protein [Mycolicibacterium peregrinum]|uniref:hypothetical protein n=1 Tax=Mycolicibacterium peregrinum TaxID=43304 RepID=UPI003AACE9FD